jgi:hypothetical protein
MLLKAKASGGPHHDDFKSYRTDVGTVDKQRVDSLGVVTLLLLVSGRPKVKTRDKNNKLLPKRHPKPTIKVEEYP